MSAGRAVGNRAMTHALPWCGAALAVASCFWAAQLGSEMLAALDLTEERAVLAEDRAVCAQLGAPASSPGFLACAMALDDVRRHERDRMTARRDGLP